MMRGPISPSAFLGVLILLQLGCGPDDRATRGDTSVRRMLSYSLLEHLDDAMVRAVPRTSVRSEVLSAGGVERPAIFAHAPSEIRFEAVPIHRAARLAFGIGVHYPTPDPEADGVRFAVHVDDRVAPPAELWTREVNPEGRPEDRRWIDIELDLERFAGRRVDIVLITDTRGNRRLDRSAWSSPILRSEGDRISLREFPVERRVLVQDLQAGSVRDRSTRLTVPLRAVLDLAAQVRAKALEPGKRSEPVAFTVRIDGEPIFEGSLRGAGAPGNVQTFAETVPLAGYAGIDAELSLGIEFASGADAQVDAQWLRSAVVRLESTPRQHTSAGRNLLLVLVDTLRADRVGLYGHDENTTPNLDRLAGESLVFERAISQSSWTMPATASVLTGLYPLEHGVTDGQALDFRFETVAEVLQESGFTTFAISANPIVGRSEGFHQGFEEFVHRPWARASVVNELLLQILEENRNLRWFGYVHYIDPHDPYKAPTAESRTLEAEYSGPYAEQANFKRLWDAVNFGIGQPVFGREDLQYLLSAYDEEIRYWDSEFGKLLDAVGRLGILDNTVLIVVSDHGEEFLEHGKLKHGMHLYDESVRVPLLIWAPGLVEPERREQPIETRLVSDAILELMGGAEGSKPGGGLLSERRPLAFGHSGHARLAGVTGRTELASVQTAEWKYLASLEAERYELFNLKRDPQETVNLADQELPVLSRLQETLDRWLITTRLQHGDEVEPDPEILEKLRALGYVE